MSSSHSSTDMSSVKNDDLISTVQRLWSPELDAPAKACWVLYAGGTMVVEQGDNAEALTARKLHKAAGDTMDQAERCPGTPSGDLSIIGPDSRWQDRMVFFLLLGEDLDGVMVVHVIKKANDISEQQATSIRSVLLRKMLERFEQDRKDKVVIGSSKQ